MAYRLTKPDREKLGMRFAEILICRANARPGDMPELASRKDWKEAAAYERKRWLPRLRKRRGASC